MGNSDGEGLVGVPWYRRGLAMLLPILLLAVVANGALSTIGSGSAVATGAYTLQANVSYGPDPSQDMDIYLPAGVTHPTPAVILVHGGSFNAGDKSQQDAMAGALATVGWAAIAINYRLLGYPFEPQDVLSALAWIRADAAALNIDPNRLAVQGSSSGGTLVLEAILDASDLGGSAAGVQAISSWSGPTDLPGLVTIPGLSSGIVDPISGYMGCTFAQCSSTYSAASAVNHVSSADPAVFLPNGSQEIIPLSQPYELASDLTQVGVNSQVFVIGGSLHGQLYEPEAMQPMVNFFMPYLGPTTGLVPPIGNPPTVVSVSPSIYQGEYQAQLVLTGTLFDPGASIETDAPGVTVGNVYVPIRKQIQFGLTVSPVTPAGTYNVVEANPDGTGAQCLGCLVVTSAPVPTISAVTPALVGLGNTYTFTITGTGFTSSSSVSVSAVGGTVLSSQDRNNTTASATVSLPATAAIGAASVTVSTPGGSATCLGCITVDPPPLPTSVTALSGGTTTLVTVTGSGFAPGLTVATNVPGAAVGAPTNVSATSFQVPITVPQTTPTGNSYTLRIHNPDGGQGYYTHTRVI